MSEIKIQQITKEFGISETGIHLLRSGYNYKTVDFINIEKAKIEKDKELKNWFFVLVLGILFLCFSIYYTFVLIDNYNDPEIHTIYIEQIIVPVFSLMMAGFCIYTGMRKSLVLKVNSIKDKSLKLSLREVEKAQKVNLFTQELDSLLKHKLEHLPSNN